MPQATDLTIANGATTPVPKTFSLLTPAAGDGGIASWALKEGTISSVFPSITARSVRTPRGRNLTIKFRLPSSYTDKVTGLTMVGSAGEMNVKVTVPDDLPEALKADFVAFGTNLFQQALVKAMLKDALPAT